MLWKTRDGRTIDVKAMTDSHLRNTISYVQRRIESMEQNECIMWSSCSMLNGEYAQYYAEKALDDSSESTGDARYTLQGLQAEQARRQTA